MAARWRAIVFYFRSFAGTDKSVEFGGSWSALSYIFAEKTTICVSFYSLSISKDGLWSKHSCAFSRNRQRCDLEMKRSFSMVEVAKESSSQFWGERLTSLR